MQFLILDSMQRYGRTSFHEVKFVNLRQQKKRLMSNSDSSVTRWLQRLELGDSVAVERLWQLFFERLVRLAHGRLQARHRKAIDAEDIALSAFQILMTKDFGLNEFKNIVMHGDRGDDLLIYQTHKPWRRCRHRRRGH